MTTIPSSHDRDAPAALTCPVDDLAVLRFHGADAAAFLHGQLSSDVNALEPGSLQWSSYNSPKGRMLANLLLARPGAPDALRAVLAADLAATIARRLSMFVLRAKVAVQTLAAERALVGVLGPGAASAVHEAFGVTVQPGRLATGDDLHVLGFPDGRVLLDLPVTARADAMAALARHAATGDAQAWQAAGVHAGVPLITAATTDLFVPQAVNLDALGGISFRKGCYPGQEIVARTHYLGRLKERLYAFRVEGAPPPPGARLYAATFGEQACGTVVNSVRHDDARAALLAVVQRTAADGDVVHVDAPAGRALERVALPYPVPEPAPRERLR